MSFEDGIRSISEYLSGKFQVRENLLKLTRKAVQESGLAIVALHVMESDRASTHIKEAEQQVAEIGRLLRDEATLLGHGNVSTAYQEYCEAKLLQHYIIAGELLPFEGLGVPPESYLLSLGDLIGEFRRLAIEKLRKNEFEDAESTFETMNRIYNQMLKVLYLYPAVNGLRRKCDVARSLMESTRSDVLRELRRNQLEMHLRRLENELQKLKLDK